MTFLHEIVDPYNYIDTRGKPVVSRFGESALGKTRVYSCICCVNDEYGNILYIAIGESKTGKIKILRPDQSLYRTFGGPQGISYISSLCFLDNGCLVSASYDKRVRVWDFDSGACKVLDGHIDRVTSVCALRDGRIASGSHDHTVRVWDSASGTCLRVLEGHTHNVTSVCALGEPGAQRIVSGSVDNTLRVWDSASGTCLRVLKGHTNSVYSVCALGDRHIASGSLDRTVRVWDSASGACLRVLEGHKNWVKSVCALGDRRIASSSDDGTVRVWDLNKEEAKYKLLKFKFVPTLRDINYEDYPLNMDYQFEDHELYAVNGHIFISLNILPGARITPVSIYDITDVDNFPKPVRSSFGQVKNALRRVFSRSKTGNVAPNPQGVSAGMTIRGVAEAQGGANGRGGRRSRKNRSVKGKSRKLKNKRRR
jgi:WD40 repeat protein